MDFSKRLKQLNYMISNSNFRHQGIWLGGIMFPEAFMTATRQMAALKMNQSLDELELKAELYDNQNLNPLSFKILDFKMEGVDWNKNNN